MFESMLFHPLEWSRRGQIIGSIVAGALVYEGAVAVIPAQGVTINAPLIHNQFYVSKRPLFDLHNNLQPQIQIRSTAPIISSLTKSTSSSTPDTSKQPVSYVDQTITKNILKSLQAGEATRCPEDPKYKTTSSDGSGIELCLDVKNAVMTATGEAMFFPAKKNAADAFIDLDGMLSKPENLNACKTYMSALQNYAGYLINQLPETPKQANVPIAVAVSKFATTPCDLHPILATSAKTGQ